MRSSRRMTAADPSRGRLRLAVAVGWLAMAVAAGGCEALQRKLTRPAKHPQPPPEPIFQFQDYSKAVTPLDRYRKHYLMFQYWNSELLDALQHPPLHGKRCRRASSESLAELEQLRGLLAEEAAARFDLVLNERREIDHRLQGAAFVESQVTGVVRQLEMQTRAIQREFFWRNVEGRVRPDAGGGG